MPNPTPPEIDAALAAWDEAAKWLFGSEGHEGHDCDDFTEVGDDHCAICLLDLKISEALPTLRRALAAQPERAVEPPDAELVEWAQRIAGEADDYYAPLLKHRAAIYILRAAGEEPDALNKENPDA